jgi:hypothetical protein
MLSQEALLAWFCRMGLSDPAQTVITNVRSSPPARLVGSGRQSVSGRYPSRKMGVTIQFESHRVELPFLHELEHDPDVLEYTTSHHHFAWNIEVPVVGEWWRRILRTVLLLARMVPSGTNAKLRKNLTS